MADLSEQEVTRIATKIVTHIRETGHDFWIDPQEHYDEHQAIREMVQSWGDARSIFTKAFIGLVVIGGLVIMSVAVMKGLGK